MYVLLLLPQYLIFEICMCILALTVILDNLLREKGRKFQYSPFKVLRVGIALPLITLYQHKKNNF